MMSDMIVFENVTKRYGEKEALSGLSFRVEAGEFYGYLGPNGAGKTTTIKSIIGLVKPDGGRVEVDGSPVGDDTIGIRSVVGYVPDNPFLYGKLTAREFFRFVGGLYRMETDEMEKRIQWLCDIFDMHGWIDRRTEEYSFGMRKKVVMSAAFLHKPKLIIVDEPTVGLDPPSARLLKDMMALIREHGATVFMSSHDLAVVEELCTRMAILHNGTIAAEGTLEELRTQAHMTGGALEQLFLKLTGSVHKDVYME